nr:hypothetical protein [Tanacetum cinerariifolium]
MESSSTREYPSLVHTFFVTYTIGGDEMLRLQRLGSNTETGVSYTEEEIMANVRKGKQRGHLPGVGRVLSGRATGGCPPPPQSTVDPADFESSPEFGGPNGSVGCGDEESGGDKDGRGFSLSS